MPDRDYTITLKNETNGAESNPIAQNDSDNVEESAAASVLRKNLIAFATVGTVTKIFTSIVQYNMQTISLRTGMQERQERIQTGWNLGKAIMNPLGTAINIMSNMKTLQYERSLEDITLQGLNRRSGGYFPGYSGSRGGNQ